MGVAYDAVGAGSRATGSSTTLNTSWSHTIGTSAADTVVLVAVSYSVSNTGVQDVQCAVTYGGTSMTPIAWDGQQGGSGGQFVEVFYLFNPASGAQTVQITTGGTDTKTSVMGNSVSYTGVGGFSKAVFDHQTSTNPNLGRYSEPNRMVFAAFVNSVTMSVGTLGATKTSRYNAGGAVTGLGDFMLIEDIVGQGSAAFMNMDAVSASGSWTEIFFELLPSITTSVAFDAVATGAYTASGGITTQSWSHTCTGSNRAVFVAVNVGISAAAQTPYTSYTRTVTYDGVAMTSLGIRDSGSPGVHAGWVELFYLQNPPTGTKTVAVTLNSGTNVIAIGGSSISYTGVGAVYGGAAMSSQANVRSYSITQPTQGYTIAAIASGDTIMSAAPRQRFLRNSDPNSGADNLAIVDYPAAADVSATHTYSVNDVYAIVAATMVPVTNITPPGIRFISSMAAEASSLTYMPYHEAGDYMVMFAHRDGSTTPPTVPGGWTTLKNPTGSSSNSAALAYKIASSSSETSGTWTNATTVTCNVYRGVVGIGANGMGSASGANPAFSTVTPQNTSGNSWVVAFAGHTSTNDSVNGTLTYMTNRSYVEGATADAVSLDTNGPLYLGSTNQSQTTVQWPNGQITTSETSAGYTVSTVELLAPIRTGTTPYAAAIGDHLFGADYTTASVPVPSGVAAGDIIVVFLKTYLNGTEPPVTPPSGFTKTSGSPVVCATGTGSKFFMNVYWKRATGADAGTYDFGIDSTSTWATGQAVRYVGCISTGNPFDVETSAASSFNASAPASVSTTTTVDNTLLVYWVGSYDGIYVSSPNYFESRVEFTNDNADRIVDKRLLTAGSTGTLASSAESVNSHGTWLGALKPDIAPTSVNRAFFFGF